MALLPSITSKIPKIDVPKQIENAKQSIKDKIKELKNIYSDEAGKQLSNYLPEDTFYPASLNDASGKFPCVRFQTRGSIGDAGGNQVYNIYLPIPDGLSFSDGAVFEGADLGFKQGIVNDIASGVGSALNAGNGTIDSLVGAFNSGTASMGRIKSQISGILQNDLTSGVAILTDAALGTNTLGARSKLLAPNRTSFFKGNNIRSFSFEWKMVARSEQEARAILNIQRIFRLFSYASSDAGSPNILLDFPPAWKIDFFSNNESNIKLPKIFGCYLKSVNTSFGEDRLVFSPDGSPLQMTLSLEFDEVRALNRMDIIEMEAGEDTRGIDDNFKILGTFSSNPIPVSAPKSSPPAVTPVSHGEAAVNSMKQEAGLFGLQ